MLLDTIFAPFVKDRPICVMARAVLERLLDAPRIDDLFARTAQHQYTRELMFSGIHVKRDKLPLIAYSEELIFPISATLQSTDRHHGIVGQEYCHFQRDS